MTALFFDSQPCSYPDVIHPQGVSTAVDNTAPRPLLTPAQALINAIRRDDHATVQRILHRPDLPRIALTLAEWHAGPKALQPCGTRAAAERHIANGEPLDGACLAARRRFYRDRKRDQRRTQQRDASTPVVYTEGPAPNPGAVRQWARDTGITISTRGRICSDVLAAYRRAQLHSEGEA